MLVMESLVSPLHPLPHLSDLLHFFLSALLPPFSGFSPAFQHIGAGWGFLESSFLSL